ncbi:MAG: hypothetical protein ABII90_15580 [Bacteroidota bacterium]
MNTYIKIASSEVNPALSGINKVLKVIYDHIEFLLHKSLYSMKKFAYDMDQKKDELTLKFGNMLFNTMHGFFVDENESDAGTDIAEYNYNRNFDGFKDSYRDDEFNNMELPGYYKLFDNVILFIPLRLLRVAEFITEKMLGNISFPDIDLGALSISGNNTTNSCKLHQSIKSISANKIQAAWKSIINKEGYSSNCYPGANNDYKKFTYKNLSIRHLIYVFTSFCFFKIQGNIPP